MSNRLGIRIQDVPRGELPGLLVELAALQGAIAARLAAEPEPNLSPAAAGGHDDLTEAEVADRLRKSPRWVRDNWRRKGLPGVKRGRATLFPEADFERWRKRH